MVYNKTNKNNRTMGGKEMIEKVNPMHPDKVADRISCAIGDEYIDVPMSDTEIARIPYAEIVEQAKDYIKEVGGFEKFAEWGLY